MRKQPEKLVPSLRFKGFTDAWEHKKLLQTTERVQGNDGNMGLPTLTISAQNGWMDQRDRFSKNIAGKEQKNYTQLSYGELSYNKGNSKHAPFGVVYMLNSHNKALVPRVYHSFKVIEGNPKFYEKMFETGKPNKELRKLITSGARMDGLLNISYQDFSEINIIVPKVEEQDQIVSLLSSFESLITLYQRKIDNLEVLTKSLTSNFLSLSNDAMPFLRFTGFLDSWKTVELKEIVKITTGKLDANAMEIDGKYDFYTSGIKKYKINSYSFVGPAITIAGNGATVGYMNLADGKFDAYQRTYVLTDIKEDRFFIYYSVSSKLPRKIYEEVRSGSIPYIVLDMLESLKIDLPKHNSEQVFIGKTINTLNDTTDLHKKTLKKLSILKKELLRLLFI